MDTIDFSADKYIWEYWNNYEGSEVEKAFNNSNPSDLVTVSREDLKTMGKFLHKLGIKTKSIPPDIFISGNIPIKDILIQVDVDVRKDMGEEYIRVLATSNDIFIMYSFKSIKTGVKYIQANIVGFDEDGLLMVHPQYIWHNKVSDKAYKEIAIQQSTSGWQDFQRSIVMERQDLLAVWYCIQILLLNPSIEKSEIFSKKGKSKIPDEVFGKTNLNSQKSKKRKAHYIKHLYFNSNIVKSKREFERHTLCWYVIGHWRKHGESRVWVNGYWKGPMRHTKANLDGCRERVIDIPKETNIEEN